MIIFKFMNVSGVELISQEDFNSFKKRFGIWLVKVDEM